MPKALRQHYALLFLAAALVISCEDEPYMDPFIGTWQPHSYLISYCSSRVDYHGSFEDTCDEQNRILIFNDGQFQTWEFGTSSLGCHGPYEALGTWQQLTEGSYEMNVSYTQYGDEKIQTIVYAVTFPHLDTMIVTVFEDMLCDPASSYPSDLETETYIRVVGN